MTRLKNNLVGLLATLLLTLIAAGCGGERETETEEVFEQRRSPIVISTVSHQDTYVKVVYGQPYKRGREIFGELEPFGEVWRTGANEATEITTTRDILLNGERVEAGTYALYTIPDPEEWTIILNTNLGQWGAFNYDPQYDYLRFTRPVQQTDEVVEALTITFDQVEGDETVLSISWDTTRVEIPVEFL